MEPTRDLDAYGILLVNGDLSRLEEDLEQRKSAVVRAVNAHTVALNQLFQCGNG